MRSPFLFPALVAAVVVPLCLPVSAQAATLQITDPLGDVLDLTTMGAATGDSQTDLTALSVDHGVDTLTVTATLADLGEAGLLIPQLVLDVNGNRDADYLVSTESMLTASFTDAHRPTKPAPCAGASTVVTPGPGGRIAYSVPRSCLGFPKSVRVAVAVVRTDSTFAQVWADAIPGDILSESQEEFGWTTAVGSAGRWLTHASVSPRHVEQRFVRGNPGELVVRVSPKSAGRVVLETALGSRLGAAKVVDGVARVPVATNRLDVGRTAVSARFVPKNRSATAVSYAKDFELRLRAKH
jgi:hypothetical protein